MRKKFFITIWTVFVAVVLFVVIAFWAIAKGFIGYMPDLKELENPVNKFASQVFTADGKLYLATEDFSDVLAHTYHRNSGAVGIALCCCADATTNDLGSEPPTADQIEAMAQVIWKVADALWLTINKDHVMTHGEAGDHEDGLYTHDAYGPRTTCERWDLEFLGTDESPSFNPWAEDGTRGGDVLRGKALWYKNNAN